MGITSLPLTTTIMIQGLPMDKMFKRKWLNLSLPEGYSLGRCSQNVKSLNKKIRKTIRRNQSLQSKKRLNRRNQHLQMLLRSNRRKWLNWQKRLKRRKKKRRRLKSNSQKKWSIINVSWWRSNKLPNEICFRFWIDRGYQARSGRMRCHLEAKIAWFRLSPLLSLLLLFKCVPPQCAVLLLSNRAIHLVQNLSPLGRYLIWNLPRQRKLKNKNAAVKLKKISKKEKVQKISKKQLSLNSANHLMLLNFH